MTIRVLSAAAGAAALCSAALWFVAAVGPSEDASGAPDAEEPWAAERQKMIREIEADVRATGSYIGKDRLDARVMDAMERVPRHEFVPPEARDHAYDNRPLAIGKGQTISQPYIVALMTDLLVLEADDTVLEVGTGSGYQAAVLAELAGEVYSIEIIEDLGRAAAKTLARLGYTNVVTKIGDGYAGWPEHAPFDAVIVTAAAGEIPPPLIEQLKPGGRMVIPIASGAWGEQLTLLEKAADGSVRRREILPVRFVPLTGDH
ncbi:MAG: protein-L-isoaspartate(D-aspartate) O-methyltransferase [Thermoanaerobaculia bacterium]